MTKWTEQRVRYLGRAYRAADAHKAACEAVGYDWCWLTVSEIMYVYGLRCAPNYAGLVRSAYYRAWGKWPRYKDGVHVKGERLRKVYRFPMPLDMDEPNVEWVNGHWIDRATGERVNTVW